MTRIWQLILLWGVVLGIGTGLTAMVLGVTVATRGFSQRRGLVIAWCPAVEAQSYPSRTITIVVPFAAGAPDSVARVMAKGLQAQTAQSVIVENRPAANGTVATEAAAKAPPDGHTLLITSPSIAVNPSIYRKLGYDVITDLEAVTAICRAE